MSARDEGLTAAGLWLWARSGQAGGKYRQTPMGGASVFGTVNVTGTKGNQTLQMGDLGSKVLPPTDPAKVPDWKVGSTPQVAWGMRFKCAANPSLNFARPAFRFVKGTGRGFFARVQSS